MAWRKEQSEISPDVRGKTDRSGGGSLSWRELKTVRKSPAEHGEPWRRFGAWWSISPMTDQDTTANVEWPGLKDGEGWYGANYADRARDGREVSQSLQRLLQQGEASLPLL